MENKFSESELIKAFKEQEGVTLGANFVARVMESVDEQSDGFFVWNSVFQFASINALFAVVALASGFYLFDPGDFGFEILINTGMSI